MLGLFDYPEGFNLSLRVNFVDGGEESEGLIFTGSEGTMEIGGNTVTVSRVPREKEPGHIIEQFHRGDAEARCSPSMKRNIRHPLLGNPSAVGFEKYVAPERTTATATTTSRISLPPSAPASRSVEDAVFGYRAAGAALLSNLSIERGAGRQVGSGSDEAGVRFEGYI